MSQIRQTVRLGNHATSILKEKAAPLWPELEDNVTGLLNKIVADWDRIRNENGGGKTARVERSVKEEGTETRKEIADLRDRMVAVEKAIADLPHLLECVISELG